MTVTERIHISMHQSENGPCCARITRGSRGRFHFNVSPASRRRLGRLINIHAERFTIRPYVTDIVGWTADSKAATEETTE